MSDIEKYDALHVAACEIIHSSQMQDHTIAFRMLNTAYNLLMGGIVAGHRASIDGLAVFYSGINDFEPTPEQIATISSLLSGHASRGDAHATFAMMHVVSYASGHKDGVSWAQRAAAMGHEAAIDHMRWLSLMII